MYLSRARVCMCEINVTQVVCMCVYFYVYVKKGIFVREYKNAYFPASIQTSEMVEEYPIIIVLETPETSFEFFE